MRRREASGSTARKKSVIKSARSASPALEAASPSPALLSPHTLRMYNACQRERIKASTSASSSLQYMLTHSSERCSWYGSSSSSSSSSASLSCPPAAPLRAGVALDTFFLAAAAPGLPWVSSRFSSRALAKIKTTAGGTSVH